MLIIKGFKRPKNDDGFVIITALLVCFLIASIVASVILITSSGLGSNAKQRHAIEARFSAESLSDSIFASIANLEDVNFFLSELNGQYGNVFGTDGLGAWGSWYKVVDGNLVACNDPADFTETCYRIKIERSDDGREIIVTIVVRNKCTPSGSNCTYRQFEQRYKVRTFVEDVLITDLEQTNIPSAVRPGAYLPNDRVDGTVHTNDPGGFRYCSQSGFVVGGTPEFTSGGSGSTVIGSFCNPSSPFSVDLVPRQFLVGQVDQTGRSDTNSASFFQNIAGTPSPTNSYSRSGTTSILLDGEEIVFNGSQRVRLPVNGVVFVAGDISSLSGTYARSLTIYATGEIRVTGNITPTGGATAPNKLLGVATPRNILINCPSCTEITIVAALNATGQNVGTQLNGRIYNENWNTGGPRGVATIRGTMISRYRPVLGSYFSVPAGVLQHGFSKNFQYDSNLLFNQPPYFFRTTQANIARSAINEGPCTESFCT